MIKPQNFDKIHKERIRLDGTNTQVLLDLSRENDNIFVFDDNSPEYWNNVILLEMNYPKNEYNIKICVIGEGDDGWYLNTGCNLNPNDFKTIELFKAWMSRTIKEITTMTDLTNENKNFGTTKLIDGTPIIHKVASSSGPGVTYEVTDCNDGTGIWTCTCPAFQYSKTTPQTCKHIKQIKP